MLRILTPSLFLFVVSTDAVNPSVGCKNPPSDGQLGFGLQAGQWTDFDRELPGTQERTHRLYLPTNYALAGVELPPPLLLYFHGWGGSHESCGDRCQSDASGHGFVTVTMTGYGPSDYHSWKHGGSSDSPGPLGPTCDEPNTNGYCDKYEDSGCDCSLADRCSWTTCFDSVEQVLAILDEVEESVCVDLDQIWAVGCSNGGMFTFELARDERSASRLKGIVPIVGLPHWGFSEGPLFDNIKMMGMWGASDKVAPPISNTNDPDKTMDTADPGWYYTSAAKVMKDWTSEKGCLGDGQDTLNENEDWGIGNFNDQLDCRQGCTEKTSSDRVVGCIFKGGHVCNRDFIWEPVFHFMLENDDGGNNNNDNGNSYYDTSSYYNTIDHNNWGWENVGSNDNGFAALLQLILVFFQTLLGVFTGGSD